MSASPWAMLVAAVSGFAFCLPVHGQVIVDKLSAEERAFVQAYRPFYFRMAAVYDAVLVDLPPATRSFMAKTNAAREAYAALPPAPKNSTLADALIGYGKSDFGFHGPIHSLLDDYFIAISFNQLDAAKSSLAKIKETAQKQRTTLRVRIGVPFGFEVPTAAEKTFLEKELALRKSAAKDKVARGAIVKEKVAKLAAKIEAGTEDWVFGAVGEFTKQRYAGSDVHFDERGQADGRQVVVVSWKSLEYKTRPVDTAVKASALPLPGSPKAAPQEVSAIFDLRADELVFVELRGPFSGDRFKAGGQGPPPSNRLHGWYKLLTK